MQSFQVNMRRDGTFGIGELALPSAYRKGDIPAEFYRRQASGEIPLVDQNLSPSSFIRTILLTDGRFTGLASAPPSAVLNFVVSGQLALDVGAGYETRLIPGDLFLLDLDSAAQLTVTAGDNCRLIQIGVAADWPGPEAKLQAPTTLLPRSTKEPKIIRMYQGADDQSYLAQLPELFPASVNQWSAPRPVVGFRLLGWEDGTIDWHPEVVNNLAVFLSGELEVEVGGGGGAKDAFRAGDVCLTQDRTGIGHITTARGVVHVATIVIATQDLW